MMTGTTLRVGDILQSEHVAPTSHANIPPDLQMYQDDVCGTSALVARIHAMAAGRKNAARYAVCEIVEGSTQRRCREIVYIAMGHVDGKPCFRYCGENGKPDGAGSSSVIPTWYPYATDPAYVAARLCYQADGEIFILSD